MSRAPQDRPGPPRPQPRRPEDLAGRLEGYIEQKACGRIRDLHVLCHDDVIILKGFSRTYHAKQLAQEAALDYIGGSPCLANEIVVS